MDFAEKLWELEQIKRLKSRYYRLQDQDRWDDWGQLFTEDCEIADPLDDKVTLRGRKAIADRTAQLASGSVRAHRGTMPDIELIDAKTARGTWALYCAAKLGDKQNHQYGYYTDEYRKDADGQWRIRRMRYDNDLNLGNFY
jgi:ketosteroid isomerase-like protein